MNPSSMAHTVSAWLEVWERNKPNPGASQDRNGALSPAQDIRQSNKTPWFTGLKAAAISNNMSTVKDPAPELISRSLQTLTKAVSTLT